jgi:hypothetical protein
VDAGADTGKPVRRLARRGWSVFGGATFSTEVDHVLVGTRGVVTLGMKQSETPIVVRPTAVEEPTGGDAAVAARAGAFKVRSVLRSVGLVIEVRPVLVLFGAGAPEIERGWTTVSDGIQEVLVLEGRRFGELLDHLDGEPLDELSVSAARAAIADFITPQPDPIDILTV